MFLFIHNSSWAILSTFQPVLAGKGIIIITIIFRSLCWLRNPAPSKQRPLMDNTTITKKPGTLQMITGQTTSPCLNTSKLQAQTQVRFSCSRFCSSSPCPDHASATPVLFYLLCHHAPSFLKHISLLALEAPLSHSPSHMAQVWSMEEQLRVHDQPRCWQQHRAESSASP